MQHQNNLMPQADDTVAVVIWTKARLARALQREAMALLTRLEMVAAPGEPYAPPHPNNYGGRDAWQLPTWSDPEHWPAARWIVTDFAAPHRRILARLLAGGEVATGELRRVGGYDERFKVGPIFKAIAGRFRSIGLRPIWVGGERTPDGMLLSIPEGPGRDLFIRAFVTDWPELAAEFGLSAPPPVS